MCLLIEVGTPRDELVQHQQHLMGSHTILNTHICWLMTWSQSWQFMIPADASMVSTGA